MEFEGIIDGTFILVSDDAVRDRERILNIAQSNGLKLLAYEGGPTSDIAGSQGYSTVNIDNRIRTHRDPRMKDVILYDLNENWFGIGGDLYMYFTLSSAYSRYGMWGLTDDITVLDTPKLQAVYEVLGSVSTAEPNLVFPQYVNGGSSRTRIILRNNSGNVDSGIVYLNNQNGETELEIPYSVDPWGVADLTTDGAGELTVGPVEVVSDKGSQSQLEGTEVFESLGAFVSVSSSELVDTQQVFVSVNSKESTGLAIYNPNPEAVTLKLVLADGSGIIQATKDLNLDAKQQMARFVNEAELFKDYFDARGEPFSGTLNLYLEDGRGFAVIGLLLDRATNGLIAVSASSRAIPY